jgi:D-alanyl-D-alanine carboxypeptidase
MDLTSLARRPRQAAVAVAVSDGAVIASACAGFDSRGEPAHVDETVFMTASITKTVMAVLALQCHERGELDLEADINVQLAKGPDGLCVRHPRFTQSCITARHLLTHASGLADDESRLHTPPFYTPDADCPMTLV